jgi:hypothetical protein
MEKTEDESTPVSPIQPRLDMETLAPYIDKLFPRPSSEWSEEIIEELATLLVTSGGFTYSDLKAKAEFCESPDLGWFIGQFMKLYETSKHFRALIDPWYVICEGIPQALQGQLYADAVNAANMHVGGRSIANLQGEPIQFSHGRNWFLNCQGREQAMRVAAFLHGRLQWADFHTSVIDSRFLAYV